MTKMYDAYFTIFYFNLINKPIGLIFDDFINLILILKSNTKTDLSIGHSSIVIYLFALVQSCPTLGE